MDLDDESTNSSSSSSSKYGEFVFAREIRIEGGNGSPHASSKGSLAVYARDQSHLVLRIVAAVAASSSGPPAERSGRGGRRSAKAANLPIEHFAPVRFVIPDLPHQGGIVVRHRLGAGECNLRPGTFGFKQLVEHQQQFVATGIANVDVVRFGGATGR